MLPMHLLEKVIHDNVNSEVIMRYSLLSLLESGGNGL